MQEENKILIGQRFRHFRKQKGVSQEILAEGICVPQTISHLERGRSIPNPHTMQVLAERLGVPLREIMGSEEQPFKVNEQITLVNVYIQSGDFEQALRLTGELLANEELLEFQRHALLVCQAESLIRSGKRHEGIDILQAFLQQQEAQQSIDHEKLCDAYNKLGNGYFALREFEKAFAAYERGYLITLRLTSFGEVAARVTKNLGLACNQLNMPKEAQFYLEKALGFYQSVSDVKSLADTFFALTLASNDATLAQKAQILYESLNLVREAHIVKQHHAYNFESKENYQNALQVLHSTAVALANMHDRGSALFTFSRALMICLEHHDMEQATYFLNLANDQKAQLQDTDAYYLAYHHRVLAKFHLIENNYTDCLHHSQISADMCARMERNAESAHSLKIAADAYKNQGMFESANDILEKVYDLLSQSRRRNNE